MNIEELLQSNRDELGWFVGYRDDGDALVLPRFHRGVGIIPGEEDIPDEYILCLFKTQSDGYEFVYNWYEDANKWTIDGSKEPYHAINILTELYEPPHPLKSVVVNPPLRYMWACNVYHLDEYIQGLRQCFDL